MTVPRVAVVGVHGFGASHVRKVSELATAGRVRFVAVADPRPPDELPAGVRAFDRLDLLLAATEVDIVVISTPIHTHVPLAEQAVRAGADVLVEKPPAASLAEFDRLVGLLEETGRVCQVGFQVHGSTAARELAGLIAGGELGAVRGIGAAGTWVRTAQYWQRSRWSGKRVLDGVPVVDGVVTNAFAHATATALLLDGSGRADQVASTETELFRANPVEADDTSVVRVVTSRGTTVVVALTLCASEPDVDPYLVVHGSQGRATFWYTKDKLVVDGRAARTGYERANLLENLLDHRAEGVPLLAPLDELGGFTRVLEAVRTAPDPLPIADHLIRWEGAGSDRRPIVRDVEKWVVQASESLALFSELNAPWTNQSIPAPPRH